MLQARGPIPSAVNGGSNGVITPEASFSAVEADHCLEINTRLCARVCVLVCDSEHFCMLLYTRRGECVRWTVSNGP